VSANRTHGTMSAVVFRPKQAVQSDPSKRDKYAPLLKEILSFRDLRVHERPEKQGRGRRTNAPALNLRYTFGSVYGARYCFVKYAFASLSLANVSVFGSKRMSRRK
jgi:hypothetical protein